MLEKGRIYFFRIFSPYSSRSSDVYKRQVPVVYRPDSLIRDTLAYEYTRIKNAAYKSSFTKELYKLIFVNPKRNRVNVMRTQNSEARFEAYAGKIIQKINIKVLPPYGTSVYDTCLLYTSRCV